MANIQTETSKIDSRKTAENKGFLLPYQLDWVFDEHRFKLCEKSIRIGMTFAQEFKVVRGRMASKADYLHTSVSQGVAMQFIRECQFWIDQYKIHGSSIGESEYVDELDNNTLCRAQYIEFPNRSRIYSFSSSPNAMRGFGGEVGIDEAAFHRYLPELIKGAGGRAMWGDPVSIWSSHHGKGEFYQLIERERANPETKWSIHTVTLPDAIEMGLLDKINSTKGLSMTPEQFIADTKAMLGSLEAYEEECLCKPRESGTPIASWFDLRSCEQDYFVFTCEIEGNAGENDLVDPSVQELLDDNVFLQLPRDKRYSLGYDIARTGHLSSVYIIETDGKIHRTAMNIKMHRCKFTSQKQVVEQALKTLPGLTGSGDKGGLGRETCENLEFEFRGRFTGVDFSIFKPHLGGKLGAAIAEHRLLIPKDPKQEIAYDIHGISSKVLATRTTYTESRNPANALSHCDIAWSAALAVANAEDGDTGPCKFEAAGTQKPEATGESAWRRSRRPDHSGDGDGPWRDGKE